MAITLYYSPGACSMAAHIVLEELGQPYEALKVDLKTHRIGEDDYYQINPQGAVPAIKLGNGELLTQNVAILNYLGDLDKKHELIPPPATLERARCLEWLALLSADVHKAFSPLFGTRHFVDSETAALELKKHAEMNIQAAFKIVEQKLTNAPFAMGQHFTVVDTYLFVLHQWATHLKFPLTEWPKYTALAQRVMQRPSVQRMLKAEGLMQ